MAENLKTPFPSVSRTPLITRFFIGMGAGVLGSIVMGIVLLLSWSVVGDAFTSGAGITGDLFSVGTATTGNSLFLSLVTLAIFLGLLTASMSYVVLTDTTEVRYKYRTTVLTQTFFANIISLLLFLPIYFVVFSSLGTQGMALMAIVHALLMSSFVYFSMRYYNPDKYPLVHLYGWLVGVILFTLVSILSVRANATTYMFLALPLLFCFLSFGSGVVEYVYDWIYRSYGADVLNIEARFGKDYGVPEQQKEDKYDL